MNNRNNIWKTSIFKWIPILLCIVPLFVSSWANIGYDETNFQLFDDKLNDFEVKIYESLQTTKNFFKNAETATFSFVPYLTQIKGVLLIIRALLAKRSDWKDIFAEAIDHDIGREIALGDLQWMEASMETFQKKFRLLGENNPDMENRKTLATNFHSDFDKMLNYFAGPESLFQLFPLTGAPLLIEFALLIAYFDPVAKTLIPLEANSSQHSCIVRNLLIEYRRRTINARLEKLHLESSLLPDSQFYQISSILQTNIDNVMSTHCNQYGCNIIIPPTPPHIRCRKGCKAKSTETSWGWYSENSDRGLCLIDDYGADEYSDKVDCIKDYALLLRHRVEQLFPVELFNKFCHNPPEATGFGYFTMKLRDLRAHKRWDDEPCDPIPTQYCDPFVRLFINGELQLETEYETDTCCYDVAVTFISKNISRNSWVKIEVMDADDASEELILRTEGSIDSFLKQGHRSVPLKHEMENYIDTVSFWQDDYDYAD